MKVAIFVEGEFIPSYSGASNRFHYLSRYIQLNGRNEIVAILCDRGWYDTQKILQEPFKTYIVNPKDFYCATGLVYEILKKEDVEILQYANIESAIFQGIPIANALQKHLVFEAHFDDLEFGRSIGVSESKLNKIKLMQKQFGKAFDAITALSYDDKEMLARHMTVDESMISVIPSGADLSEFPRTCSNVNSKTIVFLGNLFFQPNIDAVLKIKNNLSPLLQKGYSFIFGGDVSEALKTQLEDDNFIFLGIVKKLSDFFCNTAIGLAPIESGSGMRIKILNYMLAGLPVITTTEGARGFPRKDLLIIEDEISEYPRIIEELLGNPDLFYHTSKKCREYIIENLTWEIIAEKMTKLYSSISNRPHTNKELFLPFLKIYSQEEPTWLEEAKMNGRYVEGNEHVKPGQYILISDGVTVLKDFNN